MKHSWSIVKAGMALVLAAFSALAVPVGPAHAATPLKDAAAATGRYFGAGVSREALFGTGYGVNPRYAEVLEREFDSITPRTELTWEVVEPGRNQFNFSGSDRLIGYARSRGMSVRGQTLVSHRSLPPWVEWTYSAADLRSIMENYIRTVVGRYRGQVRDWDVVGEAFADGGSLRDSVFSRMLGYNYIADAFRMARAADPTAKLYYTDYGIETLNAKSTAVYNLVRQLKAQGVPIDGVSFQGHLRLGQGTADFANFRYNLQRFADLGVEVAFTQLNVPVPLPVRPADRQQQARDYWHVARVCLLVLRCRGITVAGVFDPEWPVPGSPTTGAALLFDENFQPKPAVEGVLAGLSGLPEPPPGAGASPAP